MSSHRQADRDTPRALGYRMPAEWHPHRRCWMIWPGATSVFRDRLGPARAAFVETVRAIARFEPVALWVNPEDAEDAANHCGASAEIVTGASDDCWMRDTGPTFLLGPGDTLGAVDWIFNAYGGNYRHHDRDSAIAAGVTTRAGARRFASPLVCEGGAVHVDGAGTVLTTSDVLLNANRNAGWDRGQVERTLCDALGASHVIWLRHGLVQDTDTDGHVDTVAAFLAPGRVLAQVAGERDDPNHARLKANLDILKSARDAAGRALDIVEIVQPRATVVDGVHLSLSYVNSLMVNGAAIVPVFDTPEDEAALSVLADAMPEREIVPVPALEIFRGGGGIHCITQQEPLPGRRLRGDTT